MPLRGNLASPAWPGSELLRGREHRLGSDALPFVATEYPRVSPPKAAIKSFAGFVRADFCRGAQDNSELAAKHAHVQFAVLGGGVGVRILFKFGKKVRLAHHLAL